jgi:hypothetical protein
LLGLFQNARKLKFAFHYNVNELNLKAFLIHNLIAQIFLLYAFN